jgi:hypothetical protein
MRKFAFAALLVVLGTLTIEAGSALSQQMSICRDADAGENRSVLCNNAGEVFVVGSGGGGGGSGGANDGGPPPIHSDKPGFVCCGTTFTAIKYAGKGTVYGNNLGPNAVTLVADGGNATMGELLQGTTVPTMSPGGSYSFNAVGVPYGCIAYTAAQTDGGCLTENQTQ